MRSLLKSAGWYSDKVSAASIQTLSFAVLNWQLLV